MSTEHLKPATESGERGTELEGARAERLAELREQAAETDPQGRPEQRAERAREVIGRQEIMPRPEDGNRGESAPADPVRTFLDHRLNYAQTLASVQRRLKPASRSFSKVIHAPVVEKASEVLETTVARPSVMLGTTWTALIVGTLFYFTARHYGYALSGSELLFSFIVGAVIGLTLEGLWRLLKRP